MAERYSELSIQVFDNTDGIDTCVSCNTFGKAWIYCPIFNHIMEDETLGFDETGELNRCELFSTAAHTRANKKQEIIMAGIEVANYKGDNRMKIPEKILFGGKAVLLEKIEVTASTVNKIIDYLSASQKPANPLGSAELTGSANPMMETLLCFLELASRDVCRCRVLPNIDEESCITCLAVKLKEKINK